ncbi:MAG: ERF family protein [Colwellia sp.]|nr:ERF family protein [Colwellia sp.]
MSEHLNIYQRINAVMKESIYVKKGSAGQGTGVQYDELIALLAPALTKWGIVVVSEKAGNDARARDTKKGTYIYECDFNIHYINIDQPNDRFTTLVESHSMDSGDKAPGKAITYATKISMLKVFSIECGDSEESRVPDLDFDIISNDQGNQLFNLLVDAQTGNLTPKGTKIQRAFKFGQISEIKASKFEQILKAAKA